MNCKKCGTKNKENAVFCDHCGEYLAGLCQKCGTKLLPSALFCEQCGDRTSVDSDKRGEVNPVTAMPTRKQSSLSPDWRLLVVIGASLFIVALYFKPWLTCTLDPSYGPPHFLSLVGLYSYFSYASSILSPVMEIRSAYIASMILLVLCLANIALLALYCFAYITKRRYHRAIGFGAIFLTIAVPFMTILGSHYLNGLIMGSPGDSIMEAITPTLVPYLQIVIGIVFGFLLLAMKPYGWNAHQTITIEAPRYAQAEPLSHCAEKNQEK